MFSFVVPLLGQEANTVFDLLADEDVVEVTLRTDLVKLLQSVHAAGDYQPATISFRSQERGLERWDLKVRVRGKFRRISCDFPPILLNFSKSELIKRNLLPHDKLKLVTHCLDDQARGEEHLLREYLAYRLYNEISPYSYRVQLVRMRYVDDSRTLSDVVAYGFIIEDTDELGDRIQAKECDDCKGVASAAYEAEPTMMHAMFQYLIGNADYSLPVLRNVKAFRRDIDQQLIPVGYDFDFSGFVEAPYALPANHLGQLTIRQRIYLGIERSDAELLRVMAHFDAKRKNLLRIVNDFKPLPRSVREELKEYILIFYDQMDAIRAAGAKNIYRQLRQEHPEAIPDGGSPVDYGLSERRR
ncbi:MAG: hypothetical protein D6772_01870 [Bacteroidetes bacterium]|nr:MAG: hypothetical protein D6772_01870 [Bacteroidota bacterium]